MGFARREEVSAREYGALDALVVEAAEELRAPTLNGSAAATVPPVAEVIDLTDGSPLQRGAVTWLDPAGGLLGASRWQRVMKRVVDIVVATLALVLLSPLLLLTTLAIALTSRGPVLYAHDRIGKDGEAFRFLKFRSMYRDAATRRSLLVDLNDREGPIFKIREDPRITPVGKVIRKLSIDELPQLLHVLSGRMSIVGPRPPLPIEVTEYDERARQRLMVKPGLTCIWQVSGRSDLDFDTWIDMDLEYIQSWTMGQDVSLMVRTIPAVITGRGAY